MPLALAFEQEDGAGEEDAGGGGEQFDGVAVGHLGAGWGGGGVVAAEGATLGTGGRGEGEERGERDG